MKFYLNLNLEIKYDPGSNSRENSFNRSIQLSSESLLIASLIKYCDVFSIEDFHCVCYYSKSNLLKNLQVNNENPDEEIKNQSLDKHLNKFYEENEHFNFVKFNFCDTDSLTARYFDTTLPSLRRKFDEKCYITITGLASLFRDLVKTAIRIKPGFQFESLLVVLSIFEITNIDV